MVDMLPGPARWRDCGCRRGDQQPFQGLVPDRSVELGRQLPRFRDGVGHPRGSVEGGVDRRRGRQHRRHTDQREAEAAQRGPGGFGQRIVTRVDQPRQRHRPHRDDGHGDVQRDHEQHRDVVRPGEHPGGVGDVLGGVGDQFEAFIGQEDDHPASDNRHRRSPLRGRQPLAGHSRHPTATKNTRIAILIATTTRSARATVDAPATLTTVISTIAAVRNPCLPREWSAGARNLRRSCRTPTHTAPASRCSSARATR